MRGASAVLPAVGDGYALRLPADGVDVERFRRFVAAGAVAAARGEHESAATLLGSAIGLWQGSPLADVPFLAGQLTVVALLREWRLARLRYAEAMIAAGTAAEVLPMLEQWASESPFDEVAQALLVNALHRAGQRGQAFAVYRAVRRRLVDELGVEPGPELVAAQSAAFGTAANDAGDVGAVSPLFIVNELADAAGFYRDRLGFEVTLMAPDSEPFFAIVRRNEAQFLLKVVGNDVGPQPNRSRHPYARWDAFIYVVDPDELAAEFAGRGVEFSAPLADTDDGLRGFEVADLDGYLIFFRSPALTGLMSSPCPAGSGRLLMTGPTIEWTRTMNRIPVQALTSVSPFFIAGDLPKRWSSTPVGSGSR